MIDFFYFQRDKILRQREMIFLLCLDCDTNNSDLVVFTNGNLSIRKGNMYSSTSRRRFAIDWGFHFNFSSERIEKVLEAKLDMEIVLHGPSDPRFEPVTYKSLVQRSTD